MVEGYLTSKEQQIKNSFIYLIPVIVGNLIPLLTLPVFTRVLTKEDYGVYALAQVYAVFMTGLINFGLTVGYERNFFEYKDEKRTAELLYSTLAFVIGSFLATRRNGQVKDFFARRGFNVVEEDDQKSTAIYDFQDPDYCIPTFFKGVISDVDDLVEKQGMKE